MPAVLYLDKICALSRLESKDIVDIIFLSKHYDFCWEDILKEAQEKDLWVEPIAVSKIFSKISPKLFEDIKWVKSPVLEYLFNFLETLHNDIFYGNMNSLYLKS